MKGNASLTHLNRDGRPHMVDVTNKNTSHRIAIAEGFVAMSKETRNLATGDTNTKGDVISTSILAGIMAAKRTADIIPLCHPLPLSKINIEIEQVDQGLHIKAEVKTNAKTGVEMEALTAVSATCLTIYDMLKAAQKDITIESIRLLSKSGGKSGDFSVGV